MQPAGRLAELSGSGILPGMHTLDDKLADRLGRVRHVALDMDGTLYRGRTVFEWTRPFLATLDELGIGYTYLTNNCSRSVRQYVEHLREFALPVEPDQVYTSALAAVEYLRIGHPAARTLFLLGTEGTAEDFRNAGYHLVEAEDDRESPPHTEEPDLVVCGFDTALAYPRLCRAAWWIARGKPWIATHPDGFCPTDRPTRLVDCGAVAAALAAATGVEPLAVPGKPDPRMLLGLTRRAGCSADELAMVGDRLHTDMAMARSAGVLGVLVMTGDCDPQRLSHADPRPPLVVEHVGELDRLLREVSNR